MNTDPFTPVASFILSFYINAVCSGGQEHSDRETQLNPYAYLDRDAFTSELFKVELQNLPNFCGVKVRYAVA